MRPKIKICGITSAHDAQVCIAEGVDAIGFIFYTKSPRAVTIRTVAEIVRDLPPFVSVVGVFVNEKREVIEETIEKSGIGVIQFSGDESPDDCSGFGLPVIKGFRGIADEDIEEPGKFRAGTILLDGATGEAYGGSGTLPDLRIASLLSKRYRLMLAGGLNPDNVRRVVEEVRPYALDINSGVEASPGKKDAQKVRMLFNALSNH